MINIYFYARDPYEAKFQLLINKRESTGLKHFNDPKAFTEYLDDMNDISKIFKSIIQIKHKILIAFVDMIADL